MDYYKILGVSKNADASQIKTAFRDLALKYHPDRNIGDTEAVNKMKAVNEAYAVLSDPKKRQAYDLHKQQFGAANAYSHFRQNYSQQDIFSSTDINTVFDELAKSFGFRNFSDISKEVYGHKSRHFNFKNGNVNVKGFFFSGSFNFGDNPFRLKNPGKTGWLARTLLQQLLGPSLPGQGKDLHDTIRINSDLAREGGPYAYYHGPRSKKLVVKIPPQIRHGQTIRLAGMGEEGQVKPGDLYLKVETKTSFLDRLKQYLPF